MLNVKFFIVILLASVVVTHAGVIKQLENVFETTTVPIDDMVTTVEDEITTIQNHKSNENANVIKEKFSATDRDEKETIMIIDQKLLYPTSEESMKTEAKVLQSEKLGKLLLLSTPKIAEKPKQPEENFDESEETDETIESITQIPIETTTIIDPNDEITESITELNYDQTWDKVKSFGNKTKDERKQTTNSLQTDVVTTTKITKLYPINDTLYDDNNKSRTNTNNGSAIAVYDLPDVKPNSNVGSVILEETEVDYVLVDSDVLSGSYTDADSELHLQPIVQSIEIVPSSLDDTLLINYVQSW